MPSPNDASGDVAPSSAPFNTLSPRMKKVKRFLPKVGYIAFFLAIYSIYMYPSDHIANNSYVSENALQPGVSLNTFSSDQILKAARLTLEYMQHIKDYRVESGVSLSQWVAVWLQGQLEAIQLDSVYLHPFLATGNAIGVNTIGIVRSSRSSGREAIVLAVNSYHKNFEDKTMKHPVSSVCMAITLMEQLKGAKWLSKDIILVISDSLHENSLPSWLHTYHNFFASHEDNYFFHGTPLSGLYRDNFTTDFPISPQEDFVRSGEIRGALVLDFCEESFSSIVVCPEGINGKLPNLDLLNTIDRVAMFSENVRTTLHDEENAVVSYFFGPQGLLSSYSLTLPHVQLFSFVMKSSLGVPSGPHGWFLQYNIDAVTLRLQNMPKQPAIEMVKMARIIEGIIRSLSNLMEHFHQSFYYYLLSLTFRYISIGQYMITYGVILLSVASVLGAPMIGEKIEPYIFPVIPRMILFPLCGVATYFALFFVYKQEIVIAIFLVLASVTIKCVSILEKKSVDSTNEARTKKEKELRALVYNVGAWMPVMMFLGPMSLLNFPFCLLASIVIGFISLFLRPVMNERKDKFRAVLLVLLSIPAIALYLGPTGYESHANYVLSTHFHFGTLLYPFFTVCLTPYLLSLFSLAVFDC